MQRIYEIVQGDSARYEMHSSGHGAVADPAGNIRPAVETAAI